MKTKRLVDLRVLTKLCAREKLRTVNIGHTQLSIPVECWWNLSKPRQLVLRYDGTDLYLMAPTGASGERPSTLFIVPRGTRQNIRLSAYRRRTLILGEYRPQDVDVDGLRAILCEGAVNARLVL